MLQSLKYENLDEKDIKRVVDVVTTDVRPDQREEFILEMSDEKSRSFHQFLKRWEDLSNPVTDPDIQRDPEDEDI